MWKYYIRLAICIILTLAFLPASFQTQAATPDPTPEDLDTEVFFWRVKESDVPVIMYHLVTEKSQFIGKYGITPAQLEADLIYIRDAGYTTVVMRDLIDFVETGKKLPKKPVMLTFDDGNYSDYCYLLPLLEKYNMKAVLAIIGSATEKSSDYVEKYPVGEYPNSTWNQLREMHESGLIEIQSHGYNLHGKAGAGKLNGESLEEYQTRLRTDLEKLQAACELHLGHVPTAFIYPLGILGDGSREVLESLGMSGSFSCQEGKNIIRQGDKDCLFLLHRYNRPSGRSVEDILKKY